MVGNDVSGRETDDAMTRSEEELRVGTTQRETGRARLRKYIVTENVTQTVPVQREEVRVEREPITDANRDAATSGADLCEEEHEVVLHAEEVVVDKRAVPKERVRLDKDTVTEQREVSEGVRKEQVELIDADGQPAEGLDGARGTDDGVIANPLTRASRRPLGGAPVVRPGGRPRRRPNASAGPAGSRAEPRRTKKRSAAMATKTKSKARVARQGSRRH